MFKLPSIHMLLFNILVFGLCLYYLCNPPSKRMHTHTHTHTHELHNSKYIAWIVHCTYSDLRSLRLPKIWKNVPIQLYILSSKTWLKFSELYPLGISLKTKIWLAFAEFQTKFSIIFYVNTIIVLIFSECLCYTWHYPLVLASIHSTS